MIGVQREPEGGPQVGMEGQKLNIEQPPKEDPNEWPQTRVDLLAMAVAKHGENFNTIIADRIFKRLADYSPRFLKLKWESILRKAQTTMNNNLNMNSNANIGHPLSSYSTSRTDSYGGMTISTTTTVTYSPAPPPYSSSSQATSPSSFLSYPSQPPPFSPFPSAASCAAAAAAAATSLLPPSYPSCASSTTTSSTYLPAPSPATSSSSLPPPPGTVPSLEDLKAMMTQVSSFAPPYSPRSEGGSPIEIKTKPRKPSTKKQFIGCTFRPVKEVWVAEIERDGEVLYLGQFRAPERAAKAYDVAAIALYGRKTVLNFPKIRYTQESVDTEKKVLAQKKGRPLGQLKALLDANPDADMRSEEEKAEDKLLALHADEEEAPNVLTNVIPFVEEGKKPKKVTATKKKKNGDENVVEKTTKANTATKGKKGRKPKSEAMNDEKVKLVKGPKPKRKLSFLGLDAENPAGNVNATTQKSARAPSDKKKTSANGETKAKEEGEEDEGEEGDSEELDTEGKRKQKPQAMQDDNSKRVTPSAAFQQTDKTASADPFQHLNKPNGGVAAKLVPPPPPQQVELVPDRSTTYQQFEHDSPAFRGVTTREGKTIKYRASIKDKGIAIFLGTFATKAAAARHYDLAALTLHHERAVTNFAQVSYTRAELQAMATKLRNKGCLAAPPPQMMYGLPGTLPVKPTWSTDRDAEPANDDDPAMELRDDTDPTDPCYRVPMWRRDIQRKITGNAAPMRKNLAQYLVDHPDCEIFTKQIARRYRKKTDASFDGTHPPDGEQQYEFDPNYDPQYDQQSLGNLCGSAAYPFPPFAGLPGFPTSPYPYLPNFAQYYGYMGFPQPTPQQQQQLQLQQLQQHQQLQQQQQQLQQQQQQQPQQSQQQQLQQLQLHLQQQQQLQLQQQQKNTSAAAPSAVPLLSFVDNKEKKVAELTSDTKVSEEKLDGDVKKGPKKETTSDDKPKEDKAKTKKRKTDDGESDENKLAKNDKGKLKIDKEKLNNGIATIDAPGVPPTTATTATSTAMPSPALNIGGNSGGSNGNTSAATATVAAAAAVASNASLNSSSVPMLSSSHPSLSPFLPPPFPSNNNPTAAAAMAVAIARAVFLNTPGSAAPPSLTHPFVTRPPLMHQGHRSLLPPRPMPPLSARPPFSQVPAHPQLSPSPTATTTSTSNAHTDHWFATNALASTSSSPSTSATIPPWFPPSSFPPSSSWYAPSPSSNSSSGNNYTDSSRFGIWGDRSRDESSGWADTEKVNEIENFENTWGDESNRRTDGASEKSTAASS